MTKTKKEVNEFDMNQVLSDYIFEEVEAKRADNRGDFLIKGEYVIRPDGNLYLGKFEMVKIESKKTEIN